MIELFIASAAILVSAGFVVWFAFHRPQIDLHSGPGTSESLAGMSREGERGPGWVAYEDEGPGS